MVCELQMEGVPLLVFSAKKHLLVKIFLHNTESKLNIYNKREIWLLCISLANAQNSRNLYTDNSPDMKMSSSMVKRQSESFKLVFSTLVVSHTKIQMSNLKQFLTILHSCNLIADVIYRLKGMTYEPSVFCC